MSDHQSHGKKNRKWGRKAERANRLGSADSRRLHTLRRKLAHIQQASPEAATEYAKQHKLKLS